MKKIFLSLILLAGTMTSIVSCSDETFDPTATDATMNMSSPTGGTFVLSGSSASTTAFTTKWTPANFGFSAAVSYTLQAVKGTDSFSNTSSSIVLGTSNSDIELNEKAVSQKVLNNLLLSAGGNIGISGTFKLRVFARPSTQLATSTNGVKAVSNEVTITATPYDTFDEFDRIYVPGNYQGASGYGSNWSPGDALVAKLFSAGNDGKYAGYVYMNDASPFFKITTGPSWDNNYGFQADGDFFVTTSSATNTVTSGSGNLKGDGAGNYWLKADLSGSTKTITAQKMDYGLIGQFNGWSSDENLVFNTSSLKWEKTVTLATGGMLLRGNDDWGFKMGAMSSSAADANLVPNVPIKIKENGSDIQVQVSGSYKVIVDLRNSANYTMMIVPN
jgi:hypothetical protein